MSDEFRTKLASKAVFLEPLLDIVKRGETFQSDFIHCPHCHTFVAAGIQIKEFQDITCYKCDLTSRFVSWSRSDQKYYNANTYKAGLTPIN